MSAASNLKMLLDGSKRFSGGGSKEEQEKAAALAAKFDVHFKSIPQVIGPCSDLIAAVAKSSE